MSKIRPLFKNHGGKHLLADWIVSHFPPDYQNLNYLEPYSGAAGVFFHKLPSAHTETLNDIDLGIMQIFRALRDEPKLFISKIKRIHYTEQTFKRAKNRHDFEDYIDQAVNEFVLRRMSRNGDKQVFSWTERTRGGKPSDVNAWETIADYLPEAAKRVHNQFLLNKPALQVIKAFNNEETLIYIDPPYDPTVTKDKVEHEMTLDDHHDLAKALNSHKAKILISGYESTFYKRLYKEWKCSRKSKDKKTKPECLWRNY